MAIKNELKTVHNDFYVLKRLIYDKHNFNVTDLTIEDEGSEYGACHYKLNGRFIQFRVSKITPTKTGQFVTIWKRNKNGITAPFDNSDNLDFVIITAKRDDNFGHFIFPKSVLVDKGIISKNDKGGKRGIRVYAPWDIVESNQASKTKSWQVNYFVPISNDHTTDVDIAKRLLNL